jgi:hypothetical protein
MLNPARKLRFTWGGHKTAIYHRLAEAASVDGSRAGDQGRMASSARRKDLTRLAAAGLVERRDESWTWRATPAGLEVLAALVREG